MASDIWNSSLDISYNRNITLSYIIASYLKKEIFLEIITNVLICKVKVNFK